MASLGENIGNYQFERLTIGDKEIESIVKETQKIETEDGDLIELKNYLGKIIQSLQLDGAKKIMFELPLAWADALAQYLLDKPGDKSIIFSDMKNAKEKEVKVHYRETKTGNPFIRRWNCSFGAVETDSEGGFFPKVQVTCSAITKESRS